MNGYSEGDVYVATRQVLKARGWSKTMIRRFAPAGGRRRGSSASYNDAFCYDMADVVEVEASAAWRAARDVAKIRSDYAKKSRDRKQEEATQILRRIADRERRLGIGDTGDEDDTDEDDEDDEDGWWA